MNTNLFSVLVKVRRRVTHRKRYENFCQYNVPVQAASASEARKIVRTGLPPNSDEFQYVAAFANRFNEVHHK